MPGVCFSFRTVHCAILLGILASCILSSPIDLRLLEKAQWTISASAASSTSSCGSTVVFSANLAPSASLSLTLCSHAHHRCGLHREHLQLPCSSWYLGASPQALPYARAPPTCGSAGTCALPPSPRPAEPCSIAQSHALSRAYTPVHSFRADAEADITGAGRAINPTSRRQFPFVNCGLDSHAFILRKNRIAQHAAAG